MPIWRLGKVRESLTVSSEVYKKQVLRYLEARGFYLKAGSEVEAIFADSILTRNGENREYWLEVKASKVSLGDSSFLSQLGKYMADYLSRTPANRFKMMLACYSFTNLELFQKVYDNLEPEAIQALAAKILEKSEPDTKLVISDAGPEDIQRFFEETIVIESDFGGLEVAHEKIKPTPPTKPTLPEAEYAAKIMEDFGDISPLKSPEKIFLNLFRFGLPSQIYVARTLYRTANDILAEKPGETLPIFDLNNGQLCSFNEFTSKNPLSSFIVPGSALSIHTEAFAENEDDEYTVIKILNRWIKRRCRKTGLEFDDRTKTYYYPKVENGTGLVSVSWKAPSRESTREITKPMKNGEKVNFWVHRGAVIAAKKFWGVYYAQIKPRFLFSSDGINLLEADKADKLDRNFRKSLYSRNLNQLYDVLFWYRHVFPETANLDTANLEVCLGFRPQQTIQVLEQISVESEAKPNIELAESVEEIDKIQQTISELKTLDDYS